MTKKAVEDIYVKLTHKEQILTRPDTYIGSIERNEETFWVYIPPENDDEESTELGHMEQKKITITPGLFKIYDEILVLLSKK